MKHDFKLVQVDDYLTLKKGNITISGHLKLGAGISHLFGVEVVESKPKDKVLLTTETLHHRLGHPGKATTLRTAKALEIHLEDDNMKTCEDCEKAKMRGKILVAIIQIQFQTLVNICISILPG